MVEEKAINQLAQLDNRNNHFTVDLSIKKFKNFIRAIPGMTKAMINDQVRRYKLKGWSEYAEIIKHKGSFPTHLSTYCGEKDIDMSQNSMKNQRAAEKNPALLGSTNQTQAPKQPRTASKVEKSAVQAGKLDEKKVKGGVKKTSTKK